MHLTKLFNRIIWGKEENIPPQILREEQKQDEVMEQIVRNLEKKTKKFKQIV